MAYPEQCLEARRKRRRSGGERSRYRVAVATAALAEAASAESASLTVARDVQARAARAAERKLEKIRRLSTSLSTHRSSRDGLRSSPDPVVLIVVRNAFSPDDCAAALAELQVKSNWAAMAGVDGLDDSRRQCELGIPHGDPATASIALRLKEVAWFAGAKLMRTCFGIMGGSNQLWHQDQGWEQSISTMVCLRQRMIEFSGLGVVPFGLKLNAGDAAFWSSRVWHRGRENPEESAALFAYFDPVKFVQQPPSGEEWDPAADESANGFHRMLTDAQWGQTQWEHEKDPEVIQMHETKELLAVPTFLRMAFHPREDWSSLHN